MVRDNAAEVYQKVGAVRITVGLLCALVAAFIILVTLLILYREGRELMIMENAIRRLGNLELSADKELEGFCERTDEIGMIAQTIHHVCDCLRKTIDDIGRILGEMANGNIAVDVAKNESYYIGDFKVLAESLKCIRANLTDVMRRITQISARSLLARRHYLREPYSKRIPSTDWSPMLQILPPKSRTAPSAAAMPGIWLTGPRVMQLKLTPE